MKVGTTLFLAVALCIAKVGVHGLRIRTFNDDEGVREDLSGITASPTLIYRRRLNSDRFPSIYPPTAPSNSIEETKTDSDPYVRQPIIDSYHASTEETTPSYPSTPRSRTRSKKKSLRRNRSRTRTVAYPEAASVGQEQFTPKPVKSKGGRRRKVKRPTKTKPPLAVKATEDLADKSSNSTDKNLALEIGSEDGKYALIDKFFDDKPPRAPGLVSYAASEDFPTSDNQHTLGNVKQNDIWLSDGHLLVLKGGDLDASRREQWKPIDNYERGNRPPLRIAVDSDNPPPFPVFLNETGPPVFLGPPPPFGLPYPPPGAFNESFDPSRLPPPGMIPLYPNGSIPEYFGPPPPKNIFGGGNNSLFPNGPSGQYGGGYGHGGYPNNNGQFPPPQPGRFGNQTFLPPPPFFPFPPPGGRNGSVPPFFLPPPPGFHNRNISGGPPPGYPLLPPLALNPNDNETDDPSIFLPPPYDFDYQDDSTTLVPPGPFAPGLVVPPPKNFYTVYNKTTSRPTFPPATYTFGKRPQRPNAKKPKFPMTNPPDDSEEAYLPLVTTPYPYHLSDIVKKRKQRPVKLNKNLVKGSKFEADTDIGTIVATQPITVTPIFNSVEVDQDQESPLINIPPVITNTIAPSIATTPKPLNNYVYVRGQLKSLAELNQPQHQEQYEYEATPRPPFDEHGYPTRITDEKEQAVVLQYNTKRPTEIPPKSFYYNTPKYDAIYGTYTKKPKKVQSQYYKNEGGLVTVTPRPQLPIVLNQQSPSIYLNNRLNSHGNNQFTPGVNTFQDKPTHVDPTTYYNSRHSSGGLPQKHQIVQLQSPKSYPLTTTNNNARQPHHYNHANVPQNQNYQPTSDFRPVFGPTSRPQQQGERQNKVLFPGQVTQNGNPFYDFRTSLYQQQQVPPQVDGYYSPISQYYQPVQQQQQQNFFPGSQRYFNSNNNNNNINNQNIQRYPQQQQNQGFQPIFPQYYTSQSQGNSLTSSYRSPFNQLLPQSPQQTQGVQEAYNSYREPLPQYNTESEAVTTRTIFKAGPSKAPFSGAETKTGVSSSPAVGSYYSFERGGPGGFSYKIKL